MRFQTRARLLIALMFVVLRGADIAEWLYFVRIEPVLEVPQATIDKQFAFLAANAFVTTVLLVGMWMHRRWVRSLFIAWMYVALVGALIGILCVGYTWSTFPTLYALAGLAKVLVFVILVCSGDLEYFLSLHYAPRDGHGSPASTPDKSRFSAQSHVAHVEIGHRAHGALDRRR